MKRIAFITMAALLLFAACQKEEIKPAPAPQPQAEPTATVSLAGTTWVGTYDDNFRDYPVTLTWTFEFLTDSTLTLYFDCVIAAQPQRSFDVDLVYTFDGTEGAGYSSFTDSISFLYDSSDNTIICGLAVTDGTVTLGGVTVFYPQGVDHDVFPVNTSWQTEQQLTVSDTVMPVEWGLDFWEYGFGGQVNYCAAGTCSGTSFFWQYDSTSHTGSIKINNSTYPFTYDPTTEILTLDYSTTVYGTNVTIGGTLQFEKKTDQKDTFAVPQNVKHNLQGLDFVMTGRMKLKM